MGDDAPDDQPRIDARVIQAGEPGERRVAIRTAQAFAKGGKHVVIERFVAADDRLLDGLLRDRERKADDARLIRRGGEHAQLQRAEGGAYVAVGDLGDVMQRVGGEFDLLQAKAARRVGKRAQHGGLYVRL